MKTPSVTVATMLALGVVACGGNSAPEQAKPAQAPTVQAPASGERNNAAATADSPSLDINKLKACEFVTPQEASTIIGGTLLNEPPTGFSNCAYVVDVNGVTESYRVSFSAPAMYAAMLETQTAAEKGEPVAGLWDEAYIRPRAPDSGYSLVAVHHGTLALEVWGDRKEPVVALAKLAVSRVP